jgi:hypothetical protein
VIAAVIGLIGLIAGAIVTGFLNLVLGEREKRARARVAAQLITDELTAADKKLVSAIDATLQAPAAEDGERIGFGWWLGDLPVDAMREFQPDLATSASPGLRKMLASAYRICVSRNDEHAAARTTPAGPKGDLQEDRQSLEKVRQQLEAAPKLRAPSQKLRATRRIAALIVSILVLALVLAALLVPRPDVNAATVASALQSRLGHDALVECSPRGSEWSCRDYSLSAKVACPAALSSFSAPKSGRTVLAVVLTADPACAAVMPPPPAFPATITGGEVEAAVLERAEHNKLIVREDDATVASSSPIIRFIDWIKGH